MRYSFIIPVYNRPDEVDELLQSLLEQTFRDFEVIVVEDGSSVPCRDVTLKYADRLDLHYYTKPNSGPGQTRNYGAEVVLVPGVYDDAAAEAERMVREEGYTFAHPFNDPLVIAGQGTIGLEILEQLPEVEQIVVPIGGGGLISGIAFAVKQLKPECRIVGVQAAGAASMYLSRHAGGPTELRSVSTIADGIASSPSAKMRSPPPFWR